MKGLRHIGISIDIKYTNLSLYLWYEGPVINDGEGGGGLQNEKITGPKHFVRPSLKTG